MFFNTKIKDLTLCGRSTSVSREDIMVKRICISAAAMLFATTGFAFAAEDLGVKIYPNAKKDEQWSKVQDQIMKATGGGAGVCYRTRDAAAKVADFYVKDGFKLAPGQQVTSDGAMLQKGDKLSMTIKFMKPLDNTSDARICIGKK